MTSNVCQHFTDQLISRTGLTDEGFFFLNAGMNLHARYMSQSGSQLSDSNSRMSPLEEKESIFRLFSTDPSSGPLSQVLSHGLRLCIAVLLSLNTSEVLNTIA